MISVLVVTVRFCADFLCNIHAFQCCDTCDGYDIVTTGRTIRPEKCYIFAQRYQSQTITTKFKNHCEYFLTLEKPCLAFLEYYAECLKYCLPKKLSIRRNRTKKSVRTQIRLLLEDQGLQCLSLNLLLSHITLQ